MPTFLYHMKERRILFCDTQMVNGGCPILPEILDQIDPFPRKMVIFNLRCVSKKHPRF